MEIKTCEQYVLNRVNELEKEVERLKVELLKKESELKEVQNVATTYDEFFREYGEINLFNSSTKIEAGVYSHDMYGYFNFLRDRNGKWLKERDYRDGASLEGTTNKEEE